MVLNHQHMIGALSLRWPIIACSMVECWLRELSSALGMTLLCNPVVRRCDDPGNEGISGFVMITTSHISVHFWDAGFAKFDVYSCRAFDPAEVLASLQRFDPVERLSVSVPFNRREDWCRVGSVT